MSLKSLGLAAVLALATAMPAVSQALKIGVVPGAYADAVGVAAEEA